MEGKGERWRVIARVKAEDEGEGRRYAKVEGGREKVKVEGEAGR